LLHKTNQKIKNNYIKKKPKKKKKKKKIAILFLLLLLLLPSLYWLSAFLPRSSTSSSSRVCGMATMESLIGLVNRIQRACTVLGDYGGGDAALPTLWEALPSVVVVGGQVLSLSLSISLCIYMYFYMYMNLFMYVFGKSDSWCVFK